MARSLTRRTTRSSRPTVRSGSRSGLRHRRVLRGHQGRGGAGKRNVYRVDPKSGDIRMVVDDFVQPNGLCFSPDEKSSISAIPASRTGRTTRRIFACSTWISRPEGFRTAGSLPTCPSLALPMGCAATPTGASGARWVGAIRTRTACAATCRTAICSERSTYRKRSPTLLWRSATKSTLHLRLDSLYAVYTSVQGALKP